MQYKAIFTAFLVLLMYGCASKKVSWYVLSAEQSPRHKTHTSHKQLTYIGLEKVSLPKYLQTDKMTFRKDDNQLHQDEFHRWAEPLSSNMASVIAHTMHNRLQNVDVIADPWPYNAPIKLRLKVTILRFDSDIDCVSHLVAKWTILSPDSKKLLLQRTKSYRTNNDGNLVEDIVRGMNKNMVQLSDDMARSLVPFVGK